MADSRNGSAKNQNVHRALLARSLKVGVVIIFVAAAVDYMSQIAMSTLPLLISLSILLVLVGMGAFADLLGTAVTAADEEPFHAMAAKRLHGARQALWLIRRADAVAHVLNDILGDIAGTISGAAAVTVAVKLALNFHAAEEWHHIFAVLGVGVVTALTVGGKGYAKGYAIAFPERVVAVSGRLLWGLEHFARLPITHRRRRRRAPGIKRKL